MSDILRQRSISFKDFSGGLNNYWDASSIADNEVPYLLNMEFTPNGALMSRPPITDSGISLPVTGEHVNILGYYTPPSGNVYMVATSTSKTWVRKVVPTLATSWTEIWDSKASDFIQYADQIVASRTSATGGIRWKEGDTSATAISTMPKLEGLELYRERMFGFGPSNTATETALYWSDIITTDAPTGVYNWNADSIIYVGRGNGQYITGLVAEYNSITIFKHASTYSFTYTALPEEGTMTLIQQGIGAENRECIAAYQNGYIVLHDRTLYKFQNNQYTPINAQQVRFETVGEEETYAKNQCVSIIADRAIIWNYGVCYTLNLQTGTWSQWESDTRLAYVKELNHARVDFSPNARAYGVTGSSVAGRNKIYLIEDSPISMTGSEDFTCVLRTKIYDFDTPAEWKRMYWWAADVNAVGAVNTRVIAAGVTADYQPWETLQDYTWDDLDERTWDNLFLPGYQIRTDQTISGAGPQRVSLKLDKSLRFRRAYFEVYLTCDGTSSTAPAQIFSITPMVGVKAKMTKDVA